MSKPRKARWAVRGAKADGHEDTGEYILGVLALARFPSGQKMTKLEMQKVAARELFRLKLLRATP